MEYQEGNVEDNSSTYSAQGELSLTRRHSIAESSFGAPPLYTPEDTSHHLSQSAFSALVNKLPGHDSSNTSFLTDRSLGSTQEASKPRTKISILLMGATGVGKSSFISKLTESAVEVGHSLVPNTIESRAWEYTHGDTVISLIDTPGFNDTARSELEILKCIATFILGRNLPPIVGVIYMHRITDRRVTGSSRLNLDMLRAMCGPDYLPSVMLVTTMWDTVSAEDMVCMRNREKELNSSSIFWGDLIAAGATSMKYKGTHKSAQKIIDQVLAYDTCSSLHIMIEMQAGVALVDTAAGRVLTAEVRRREEKMLHDQLEEDKAEETRLRAHKASLEEEMWRLREGNVEEARLRVQNTNPEEETSQGERIHRRRASGRSRGVDESPSRRANMRSGFAFSFKGLISGLPR